MPYYNEYLSLSRVLVGGRQYATSVELSIMAQTKGLSKILTNAMYE